MKYITLKEMAYAVRRNIYKVPHDIDFVIGVPRSGMIPASMVAEFINVPLIDVDSFCAGAKPTGGGRLRLTNRPKTNKVLVLDDTVFRGKSMNDTKMKLARFNGQYQFTYAAVYLEGSGSNVIDFFFEDVRKYTHNFTQIVLYEWNIFHHIHSIMDYSMYDMDGVMCLDPPDERNIEEYEEYIKDAVPLFTPTVPIGAIVTYRLGKYKDITTKWLEDNGIRYKYISMFPANSWEERNKSGISPEKFKATLYKESHAKLFVESNESQARKIFEMSGKPVLCVDTNVLFGGQ